ncbi:MAG: hypothetical protein JWQ14_3037, partial [Adhaeribacter sp.]|nr:hypothetical protein [Adhaeribacter sp.]
MIYRPKILLSLFTLLLLFMMVIYGSRTQAQNHRNLVAQILHQTSDSLLQQIMQYPNTYQVQILYTQINRDQNNRPVFTSYSYNLNPRQYFYPASTVKLAGALAALEKINHLNIPGLTKDTPLRIDSPYQKQTRVATDTSAANGKPSV